LPLCSVWTDFHGGFIETFLPAFVPVALPGSFSDPNLPSGYAPFGIQVVGRQVFVTYALPDALKHDPVVGAGNGIVNIFDMDGNFVKRFATGGALNAPRGIAQASTNFGPFSNDILIGNVGDGTISAFDPASGRFVGPLLDGNGNAQSTQFMMTVTPAGGFTNNVRFSCSPTIGITCAFSPATVTTGNGAVSTTLTVTTSASVSRYGMLTRDTIGPWVLLLSLGLCSLAIWTSGKVRTLRPSLVTATVAMAIVAMGLAIGGCGGYGNTTRANRGTVTVMITAQSGTLSHSKSVTVTVQ